MSQPWSKSNSRYPHQVALLLPLLVERSAPKNVVVVVAVVLIVAAATVVVAVAVVVRSHLGSRPYTPQRLRRVASVASEDTCAVLVPRSATFGLPQGAPPPCFFWGWVLLVFFW